MAYAYLLTTHVAEEKARFTVQLLKYKVQEYEQLRSVIENLKRETQQKCLLENDYE